MTFCRTFPRYPLSVPTASSFLSQTMPDVTQTQTAFSPRDIYAAYGLAYDAHDTSSGRGKTAAVVGAYDTTGLQSDFEAFCRAFDLPVGALEIYATASPAPVTNAWSLEARADTEWLYAMCPTSRIVCVSTPSASLDDLFDGIMLALQKGADIVSLSWGIAEFRGQEAYSERLARTGKVFVASSGDSGGVVSFPSSSDAVISVGGTVLHRASTGRVFARSAWQNGGGGASAYTKIPAWQARFSPIPSLSGAFRATPDVACDAALSPGYAVFAESAGGFMTVGGTSVAAPVFSGICARILQKADKDISGADFAARLYALAGKTEYTNSQKCFYDVTVGTNGKYFAKVGYDLCTGLGAPNAEGLMEAF